MSNSSSSIPESKEPSELKGRTVVYDHEGSSLLAVVIGGKKEKYLLFTERGRELDLNPQRLQLLSSYKPVGEATTIGDRIKALENMRLRAESMELPIPVSELWELASSSERDYSLEELSGLLFSTPGAIEEFSLRLKLTNDKVFFKRNQNSFVPRPPDVVTELLSAERKRLEQEKVKADFIEELVSRIKNPAHSAELDDKFASFLRLLKKDASLATLGPNETKEVHFLISEVGRKAALELPQTSARAAFKILMASKCVAPTFNPVFERSELRRQFSKETNKAAAELANSIEDAAVVEKFAQGRLDLRHLEIVTVDDASTKDIDDALSFVALPENRWQIGVHITDVGSMVRPASALAKEALARATSIYLPEAKLHMFPKLISQGALSLNPGETRPAISCLVELEADGTIGKASVQRTLIASKKRITYDELDQQLKAKSSPYLKLYEFCVAQEERRFKAGAFRVNKPELFVDVSEGGQVSIGTFDEHSPARHMVAELAILTNQSFAQYAADAKVPYIFRTQAAPVFPPRLAEMEDGPSKDFLFRINLPRSFTGTKPQAHSGLGLSCYGQATSPIRRYADLVNQWQLGAHLTGEAVMPLAEVEAMIAESEVPLSRAQAVTKDSRRYWLLKYIEQKGLRSLSGTVVRIDGKMPLVELDEVSFINTFRSKEKPNLNQKIIVTIKELSAIEDVLKLEA